MWIRDRARVPVETTEPETAMSRWPRTRRRGCHVLLLLATLPALAQGQTFPEAQPTRVAVAGDGLMLTDPELSPNGRWIVLTREQSPNRSSLWLMPAAGGEMVQLTGDGYADSSPEWSPAGDRIFFDSTRPSRGGGSRFVMSIGIDPATGAVTGAPRQVTIERNSGASAPAPDGGLLAYVAGREIRLVPANGGVSRSLVVLPRLPRHLAWEPDGSAVYFAMNDPSLPGLVLYRIDANGGDPKSVYRAVRSSIADVSPAHRLMILSRLGPGDRERTIEVVDWSGEVLTRNVVQRELQPRALGADGRSFVGRQTDVGSIMRVRPSRGGEPRDLTDGSTYDWPVAWTADGRAVIAHASEGGMRARILPIDGSRERTVPIPAADARAAWDWGTPSFVTYVLPQPEGDPHLVALDLSTGQRTVLSESMRHGGGTGPGGHYRDVDGIFFVRRANGRVAYMSGRPGEEPRVVHSAPEEIANTTSFAFHGHRRAFLQSAGDSVALMIGGPGAQQSRVLMMVGSGEESIGACCRTPIAFSHDGEWLALSPLGPDATGEAIIVRVPAAGRATDVRRVDVDADYWYDARWLPDASGFTAIAGRGGDAWVAFVPNEAAATARALTRDDAHPTWGHELSPDGRWIAYPAEVWRGSSIWRFDLPRR